MKKKNILLVIGLIVYVGIIVGVISYTYSYYTATVTNTGVISGTVASYDLELSVSKVGNSGSGDLVPQLDSAITSAIVGTNGTLCLDGNGNTICQVYKIDVENLSNSAVDVYGYLDLDEGSNPNLKWAQVSGTSSPTLLSNYNSYITTLLANEDTISASSTKTYYIVLWISETGTAQSDTGSFSGVVTFTLDERIIPAKQTLTKLGLNDSVNDTIPDFDYMGEYKNESCTYEGNYVSGGTTEESCKLVYKVSYLYNAQIGYYYSSIADDYVGTGVWDSTNSVCKYNGYEVYYSNSNNVISEESLCGDVYALKFGNIIRGYYSGVEEVGSGTWEILTTETGIYAAKDDLGISYYFRGAVDNNWVYFAGIYWRIIRINGDGSIRMVYSGTTAPTSEEAIVMTNGMTYVSSDVSFNDNHDDNKYVGYTYDNNGVETNSTVKEYLENTWYADTFLGTEYEQYLADAIYCNDREISTNSAAYSGWGYDVTSSTLGQGTTPTIYKSEERLGKYTTPRTPSLKCSQLSDRYTVNTSIGNGKLKYKVGLITADEAAMVGSIDGAHVSSLYLYTGDCDLTLTPLLNGYIWILNSSSDAFFCTNYVNIRPVISITSNATILGNGTYSDPFTIS